MVILVTILLATNIQPVHAQEEFRSLQGTLSLDVGIAEQDLDIRVTVRNHSFIVLPFPPGFIFLRPITSEVSTIATIETGTANADYSISQIIKEPVDYTIQIECLACQNTINTQFYSPAGNQFGLVNEVFIDPADLPASLNLSLITQAKISGEIQLIDNLISDRDMYFTAAAVNALNTDIVYQSVDLVLPQGANSVAYAFAGLDRSIAGGYLILLECTNCFGQSAVPQASPVLITEMQNYSLVNFIVSDLPFVPIPAILELLL